MVKVASVILGAALGYCLARFLIEHQSPDWAIACALLLVAYLDSLCRLWKQEEEK